MLNKSTNQKKFLKDVVFFMVITNEAKKFKQEIKNILSNMSSTVIYHITVGAGGGVRG